MKPTNRAFVSNMLLGGAFGTVVCWFIEAMFSVEIPGDVKAAVATLAGCAVGSLGADPEGPAGSPLRSLAALLALGAVLSAGACSSVDRTPTSTCYDLTSAYDLAQVGILEAVTDPTLSLEARATLKTVDRESMQAVRACRAAVASGDTSAAAAAAATLREALRAWHTYQITSAQPPPEATP